MKQCLGKERVPIYGWTKGVPVDEKAVAQLRRLSSPGEFHPKALAGRVEDWRANGRVRWCFPPLSRRPSVRLPWSRFQPPPRQTRRAVFRHRAFLLTSPQGLWDLLRWERFRHPWPNPVVGIQPERPVQPPPTPPLPAKTSQPSP